ncbi:hypothetical protein FJ546_10040 [Mesorhizobium sp. B2-4-19]|uniref:hypothetical protein n=1 Tax=Mesorhizobium sp. B2-4-19 TaxID=2589930 RepID=UPI0011269924|nr:hypothetical protein [Mesorhizobium sp. B2-4-19]TPK65523.1 hypothetical protein FJ546_10040 [Mesorhizobium sp. B2-4-19]
MTEQFMKKDDRNRRRTCRDRWRYRRHQHRRRLADPATSFTAKFSALLLFLIGRAPTLPVPVPQAVPAPQPLPPRTDVSAEQGDRESGEGGQMPMRPRAAHGRYRSRPSYSRILRDLSRPAPAARAAAAATFLARVPMEALDWVYMAIKEADWRGLRQIVQPGMTDAEADAALLKAARDARLQEATEPDEPTPDDNTKRKPPR